MLWSDNMVIPVGAPNPTAAEAFMNYVYDPKNQAQIAAYNNYVTPVNGVQDDPREDRSRAGERPADLPDEAVHQELRRRSPPWTGQEEQTVTRAFEGVLNG